jgi:hypothetical protein
MILLDWMGRDILVPCDADAVWKRVAEQTDNLPVDGWSFDAWKKTLKVSGYRHVDGRREYQNYTVDISDLITGKMEVVSPGYKGEVNND